MKKIIIIFLFATTLLVTKSTAQTPGVPDTLAYLHSIINNKAFYIGKPVFNDSLKIKIKYFHQNTDIYYDIRKETSTGFGFYFPQNQDEIYLTYPQLEIYWQPYLDATQSISLFRNNNGGGWSSSVAGFYANGIIADIKIRE